MKKLSKAERRRRTQNQRKGHSFYFNFDLDKFNGPGKKKNIVERRMEAKWKREGGVLPVRNFEPQKMPIKLHNVTTGLYDERMVDQCCGTITGSDPPVRCEKPAMKGEDYCRTHGGKMIKEKREKVFHKYSAEELRDQIRELTKGDLLDIKEEVALVVIVLKKHLEKFIAADEGLTDKQFDQFLKGIETITKNVERLHKMKYGEDVITKEDLDRKLDARVKEEVQIIDKLIKDADLKQEVLNAFANITD